MMKIEKSPCYRSSFHSWYADCDRDYINIQEKSEQSFTFLKSRKHKTGGNKRHAVQFHNYEFKETKDGNCGLRQDTFASNHDSYNRENYENCCFETSKKKMKESEQSVSSTSTGECLVSLAYDGSNKKFETDKSSEASENNMDSRKKPGSVKVSRNGENRRSRNQSEKSTKEYPEHGPQEGADKEDRKGKKLNTPAIKACNCQELTPEQKEQNEKPPPCNCDTKSKKRSVQEKKEKYKECPECDRIKLNANLIRAIQRINELQAQRKLTESDVKVILEEEYRGDIFGYREQKKPKGPDTEKKTTDEPPLKTIAEREQEMREEFKEIIENEVSKFEDRKKKKIIAPLKVSPQTDENTEKKKLKKKKKKAKTVPLEMQDVLYWMYPRHHFGHRRCLPPFKEVPKTMGWLWNSSKGAGLLKPGRGWVPGAIRRDVIEVIKQNRKDRRGVEDDEEDRTLARSSQRSGTSKSKDNQRGHVDRYNPTFHMHKKDGYYYFSLYPVKTDELDKIGKDPKPTMFKVSAKQPDGSEGWSTDDESYELEFVTPSAMRKQIKKPLKRNISQQYQEDDFFTKKKEKVPEPEEKPAAPPAKKNAKGKGKQKKGKKK